MMNNTKKHSYKKSGSIGIVLLLAMAVGVLSTRFLTFQEQGVLLDKPEYLMDSALYLTAFYLHVIGGILALILGPLQFIEAIRRNAMKIHRILGKGYVFNVGVSGICGFFIAFFAEGGLIGKSGFALMALVWLFTTFKAYASIIRKDIEEHRKWMTRSYAVTFAAVSLRIGLLLALFDLLTFEEIYPALAWLSWLVNIVIAEYLIVR